MVRALAIAGVVAVVGCSANDDLPSPQIASVTPTHAPPSTTVVIAGSYFCHQPANEDPLACANMGSVSFDTSVADASTYTDTMVVVDVPNNPGSVEIRINVLGHVSNGIGFTID
jgi:hypothetical protein